MLADLTSGMIVDCREELLIADRTNTTVNRYMASLGHVLSVATRVWDWMHSNPIRKIKKLPELRGRI